MTRGIIMVYTIEVIFDGKVFKPCSPVHLKKNGHYKLHIEVKDKKNIEENPFLRYIHTPIEHGSLTQDIDKELYGE